MLVYGDLARTVETAALLGEVEGLLREASAAPPGIVGHAALVSAFIALGELAQGIADAEFAACGADAPSPAQDAAMAALIGLAHAVHRSWDGQWGDRSLLSADLPPAGLLPADPLRGLAAARLPERVTMRRPEGYAFYTLYPEAYLRAASALGREAPVRVIGIRSIGTGLAALVAAACGARGAETVRPTGDPFRREIRVADTLAARLLGDPNARFAIADEGPGLSGSSFGAVADWLEAKGVARGRLHVFPSHPHDLGPEASEAHRERWRGLSRHVVGFDDLVLRAERPAHRLESWVAEITGPAEGPLTDVSGGAWRAHLFPDEASWPPSHLQQERRKFLLRAGGRTWFLKFVGLGQEGARTFDLARRLHAAGFAPEPAGHRHGFSVEHWLDEARPLSRGAVEREGLVRRLASYIAFRERSFALAPDGGASLETLFAMARHNSAQALGEEAAGALAPWRDRLAGLAARVRRVRTDNRLHPWEWLRLPDGRLLKTDAVDHHAAHDLVGGQDAAWDLAGAEMEFDLSAEEAAELHCLFARAAGRAVDPDLLALCRIFYAAFQLGYWTMAADGLADLPAEAGRTRAAAERYESRLAGLLRRL